jgi:hypothetical protein
MIRPHKFPGPLYVLKYINFIKKKNKVEKCYFIAVHKLGMASQRFICQTIFLSFTDYFTFSEKLTLKYFYFLYHIILFLFIFK